MKRRSFIKLAAISSAGIVLPIKLETLANENPLIKPLTLITPNDQFYILQIGKPAVIEENNWRLAVTGMTEKMVLPYTLDSIKAMESVETMRTLKCIGDPIGTEQMSNAMWKGVRLKDVLVKSGIKEGVKVVVFVCADGYHTAIPLEDAIREDTILAYEMNGESLPTEHGYPLRLLNPGHYGTKNPKWIVNIQLAFEHVSYWEKRGWDPVANIKLATVIGTPTPDQEIVAGSEFIVSGAAFDGGHHGGIKTIEVSIDYGETWHEAEIWAKDSPLAWVLWKWVWDVPKDTGPVEIYARATTNSGITQDEIGITAEPVDAIGYHTIDAKIVEP